LPRIATRARLMAETDRADVPAENGIIDVVDGFVWLPEG
jgi:hypothetical protein